MSRLPLRGIFRVANSGLEKIALACAAFGLMHATARASEPATPSQSIEDPWLNPAAPQTLTASDAWSGPVATRITHDDAWSAPVPQRVASNAPVVQAVEKGPAPVNPVAAIGLTMDSSDWDTKPRGRSPGLIASSDTWRSRQDVSAGVAETEPAAPDTRVEPSTPAHNDALRLNDPSTAPVSTPLASPANPAVSFDAASQWTSSPTAYEWVARVSGAMRVSGSAVANGLRASPVPTSTGPFK
jgi:hypothetical protein